MKANYTIHNFAKRLVMVLAVGLMAVNVWGTGTTGTIVFGNGGTKISSTDVSGDDNQDNTWTITTTGTTSFTQSTS